MLMIASLLRRYATSVIQYLRTSKKVAVHFSSGPSGIRRVAMSDGMVQHVLRADNIGRGRKIWVADQ